MIYIFLGPPGSGKDTQAELLANALGGRVISVGEVIREAIAANHPRGREMAELINHGNLIPDDLLEQVLEEYWHKVADTKVILTGFPRTVTQWDLLERVASKHQQTIQKVIYLEVPDEVVVDRLSGRLYAPGSDRTYHVKYNPPKQPGVDDETGERLVQRADDHPEAIKQRLDVFKREIQPILDEADRRGWLFTIDGDAPILEIQQQIRSILSI